MQNNVPRIGINTGSVNPYVGQQTKDAAPKAGNDAPAAQASQSSVQVSPDAVYAYMAGTANINAPRTYDINKYVSPESAARIAAMMGDFESAVTAGLLAIEKEGLPLSEADKYAVAASMVE